MRLGLRLLNSNAQVNQFSEISQLKIAPGETVDLVFQLIDLDQKGLRYIPAAGATIQVSLPRNVLIQPDPANSDSRISTDYSISRAAALLFAGDASVYKFPLIAADTATMTSTNIKVTVTESGNVKIATLTQAIKMIDGQEY